MKFSKALLAGIFSLLLFISFVIYRHENMLQTVASFFVLIWFVQVPGGLILILSDRKLNLNNDRLRIILFGNVIGLALAPLLYYLLFFAGLHKMFSVVITVLNVVLALIVWFRMKNEKIQFRFSAIDKTKLNSFFLLLFFVMIICSIREFSQMLNWNFVFNTKRDTDAGSLMSMVIAIKNYGYLVNMNYGGVPMNYHHFYYLIMALVMKTSHAGVLPVYQVVFPLYSFFLMALAAYHLVLTMKFSENVALLSAVSMLLLDDFYSVNQVLKIFFKHQPLFVIESIEWLHNSPSTVISLMMMFVLLAEFFRTEKEKWKWNEIILFVICIASLACYKISTWACLVGGMSAAAVFFIRRKPQLLLVSMLSGIAGIMVFKFLSGFAPSGFSSDSMIFFPAYPVLRSEAVTNFLRKGNDVCISLVGFKIQVIILLLSVCYVFSIFGLRIIYMFKKLSELWKRRINLTETIIFFTVITGALISFTIVPQFTQHNSLYFILTGMYLLSVIAVPSVYNYMVSSKQSLLKYFLIGIFLLQLFSGTLQVLQPFTNPVKASSLSADWFEGMHFIKQNTNTTAMLAYNRRQLKENYYKDDFDFVPVYSERSVVLGGKQYFPDYESRKVSMDSLFTTTSSDKAKKIIKEYKINYIVFDKWKGDTFQLRDTSMMTPVFSNAQIDIFKIN